MPKGALLHAHLDATVNAEFLLELALKQPGMHLRIHKPLVASSLSENLPEFRILPKAQFSDLRSLGDVSYNPGSWVSFQNARKNFPTQLGGQEGFDKWVIGSMTINPAEAYGTHNTTAKVCHYALFYLSFFSGFQLQLTTYYRFGKSSRAHSGRLRYFLRFLLFIFMDRVCLTGTNSG
jgi:hypothetical protein